MKDGFFFLSLFAPIISCPVSSGHLFGQNNSEEWKKKTWKKKRLLTISQTDKTRDSIEDVCQTRHEKSHERRRSSAFGLSAEDKGKKPSLSLSIRTASKKTT